MEISDENNCNLIKPTNVQEMGGKKFGVEIRNNRRALGVINQNLVGAHPYPCVVNKRILRNENCDKKPPIPVHRPITRKFAAQMVSTQNHHHPEEIKKIEQSDDVPKHVKQHEGVREQTVAMSMEQTEMILNDKDHMEVEMEDIFEESVMDIDSLDAKNPLAFVDCLEELYAYYRKMENTSCIPPNYMAQQFDINERMRAILIDWLIEVHHKFELREETLFLTVNLIDRFLAKESMVRKKLQLVGLVAMLLACKYEEVSVPVVDDLIFISDKAYSKEEILEMEKLMLNRLQFNMSIPTPYVFMRRFLKAAQADTKLELLSFFFIELCLVEYEMLKYPPSFLAAVAVYTAQCSLYGVVGKWNKTCEFHCRYSGDELLECSRMIVGYHQKAATGKLTGVYRKYSTSKFGFAAKCEPAVQFLV